MKVLQSHDHTYCRGQYLSSAGTNFINHPGYIISVAGQKMYGLNATSMNRIIVSKKLEAIKQRTQIPDGEETEYSTEELQKFRLKYQNK
jgi:uncharacterized protein (DUF39 family)